MAVNHKNNLNRHDLFGLKTINLSDKNDHIQLNFKKLSLFKYAI